MFYIHIHFVQHTIWSLCLIHSSILHPLLSSSSIPEVSKPTSQLHWSCVSFFCPLSIQRNAIGTHHRKSPKHFVLHSHILFEYLWRLESDITTKRIVQFHYSLTAQLNQLYKTKTIRAQLLQQRFLLFDITNLAFVPYFYFFRRIIAHYFFFFLFLWIFEFLDFLMHQQITTHLHLNE